MAESREKVHSRCYCLPPTVYVTGVCTSPVSYDDDTCMRFVNKVGLLDAFRSSQETTRYSDVKSCCYTTTQPLSLHKLRNSARREPDVESEDPPEKQTTTAFIGWSLVENTTSGGRDQLHMTGCQGAHNMANGIFTQALQTFCN